jgi:molecular chaperone HscB
VDHFARFGLPRRYEVDPVALERAYERLSFQLHPDLLVNASPEERQRAQQAAADLNAAYRTLSDATGRAEYLIGLLAQEAQAAGGVPSGWKLDATALPKDFLQEMFVLQEEVEEAQGAEAEALRSQVNARRVMLLGARGAAFDKAGQGVNAELLQTLQSLLNQERYVLRLLNRLDAAITGPGTTAAPAAASRSEGR